MFHLPHNYALLKIDTFILEISKSTFWKICNVFIINRVMFSKKISPGG